jgi:hypothetical protein
MIAAVVYAQAPNIPAIATPSTTRLRGQANKRFPASVSQRE